jgi:hypothetical protein
MVENTERYAKSPLIQNGWDFDRDICQQAINIYICTPKKPQKAQRSGRAVECGGLENR